MCVAASALHRSCLPQLRVGRVATTRWDRLPVFLHSWASEGAREGTEWHMLHTTSVIFFGENSGHAQKSHSENPPENIWKYAIAHSAMRLIAMSTWAKKWTCAYLIIPSHYYEMSARPACFSPGSFQSKTWNFNIICRDTSSFIIMM